MTKKRYTYEEAIELSQPNLCGFNPDVIPWQREAMDILTYWNYEKSTPEMLFSGTYGSAKTILLAHLIVKHCMKHDRARVCIARKGLPDLKRTLYAEICEHIEEDMLEGVDYERTDTIANIRFRNRSEIISASWSDKRYSKFRSLRLSGLVISEIVENTEEDKEAFLQLKGRVRRIPHIKENFILADTNPDSEGHWVYKYWLARPYKNRPVVLSDLRDNPFIDDVYRQQLEEDLDERSARRYLKGEWCDIITKRIYYNYEKETHYKKRSYNVDTSLPIMISFDFNIAEGKPLSVIALQRDEQRHWHVFNEVVIEGISTTEACHKIAEKGLLDYKTTIEIHGDATGRAKDTRSKKSDFALIKEFMESYRREEDGQPIDYVMKQPLSNPPIKKRHNKVNSVLKNLRGEVRLSVYKDAPTADEGFRLTKLLKNRYEEDDTIRSQHITTAIGYAICRTEKPVRENKSKRL
jgi:hypothetical protein